jgi:hypothetical protein
VGAHAPTDFPTTREFGVMGAPGDR